MPSLPGASISGSKLWTAGRAARWLLLVLCTAAAPASRPTTAPAVRIDPEARKLIETLANANPAERERAGKALIGLGNAGRMALLDATEHEDPQVRLSAADLLLKMPFDRPGDPSGVAGYLKWYGKPSAMVRITYIPSIRSAAGAAAPQILLRLLGEEPSDEVRWAIVNAMRTLDRKTIPLGDEMPDRRAHSPNLALLGWLWETRDYPTAMKIYRQWLAREAKEPTADHGAADFAFKTLLSISVWDHDYDTAAEVFRVQAARLEWEDGEELILRSAKVDELFALHATFGPMRGIEADLKSLGSARAQVLYALGRLYQNRMGENLVADALYRSAYAVGMGSVATRDAAGEFLINHAWNDLAEGEVTATLAIEPSALTIQSANANLRLGMLLAQRGDDLGAAQHKERAMEALGNLGGTLTRRKGDRTLTDDQVRDQLRAEIHWHYYRAARMAADTPEMEKRLQALLSLAPDDEHIVLDIAPALLESGRKDDVARLFSRPYVTLRDGLRASPDDTERMNNLAWFCGRCGQHLDEALGEITKALRAKPENYAYLDTAAEVYFQLGQIERAIELEQLANRLNPGNEFLQSQLKRFQSKSRTGSHL